MLQLIQMDVLGLRLVKNLRIYNWSKINCEFTDCPIESKFIWQLKAFYDIIGKAIVWTCSACSYRTVPECEQNHTSLSKIKKILHTHDYDELD